VFADCGLKNVLRNETMVLGSIGKVMIQILLSGCRKTLGESRKILEVGEMATAGNGNRAAATLALPCMGEPSTGMGYPEKIDTIRPE
jgi:hypothetical protein